MYVLLLVFVANDAWMYKTPIAKITHVKEEQTASRKAVRGGREFYYKQTMEARILNGTEKGQNIVLKNTYTSSSFTFVQTLIKCIISSFYMCFVIDYPHNPIRS